MHCYMYVDSGHGQFDDGKAQYGHVIVLAGGTMKSVSKKHDVVTAATNYSEYIGQFHASQNVMRKTLGNPSMTKTTNIVPRFAISCSAIVESDVALTTRRCRVNSSLRNPLEYRIKIYIPLLLIIL
eukprot:COSAG05_NODE_59_length_23169_cov_37.393698_4_plen_126_part_00